MKKWNCHVCDRDFKDSEEMDAGICRKCAKYTADIQSACAAGPWRTDVDNAPRDGSDILGYFSNFGNPVMRRSAWESQGGFWGGKDCFPGFAPDELLAFAVPNPPQVTT